MNRTIFALISIAFLLSSCGDKPAAAAHRFEFGLISQERTVEPLRDQEIPRIVGLVYGWKLTFPNLQGAVKIREVLTLPGEAEWRMNNQFKNSKADGPSMTQRLEIKENGRVYENEIEIKAHETVSRLAPLRIHADDPLGVYELKIYADGELIRTHKFTLVESS